MDHSTHSDAKQLETNSDSQEYEQYVVEEGKRYRVPYKMVKKLVFANIKKEELIDIPHSARLQYRLMLMDPILKATVDFTKRRIGIIYNQPDAKNAKEKMSIEQIKEFLLKEGIHTDAPVEMENIDYDYYKNLYSYAYNPSRIREKAPYGYTTEEWQKMRPEWDQKMLEMEKEKKVKFKEWQDNYLESTPEAVKVVDPNFKPKEEPAKGGVLGIFGKKKKASKEKGFWFHGI